MITFTFTSCVANRRQLILKSKFISILSLSQTLILSIYSLPLHSLDDMLERNQGAVRLHDVDVTALRQLIDYTYTGEITITEDNVQVLLPASSLLQIHSVREACCKFLLRQLHPSNCLGIRSFAGELKYCFCICVRGNQKWLRVKCMN